MSTQLSARALCCCYGWLLVIGGCGGGGNSSGAGEAGLVPIRWSTAELGILRVEAIDAELARPFEAPVTVGRKTERATAADCASTRDLLGQNYAAIYPRDIATLSVLTARCIGLETLKSAKPARLNFLPTKPYEGSLIDLLPANLAPGTTRAARQAIEEAVKTEQPLPKVEVTAKFEGARDDEIHIAGEGWQETLVLLAQADFDADGKQDWLVRADLAVEHGTNRTSRVFLLTRDTPGGLIRAIRELKP